MSAPLRFLLMVVGGWALFRAGAMAGPGSLVPATFARAPAPAAAVRQSSPPAAAPAVEGALVEQALAAALALASRPPVAISVPPAYRPPPAPAYRLASAAPAAAPMAGDSGYQPFYSSFDLASTNFPSRQPDPLQAILNPSRRGAAQSLPVPAAPPQRVDRLALSSWMLLRGKLAGGESAPDSLASGGMLGGSQAGSRLAYQLRPRLAASLRASAPVESTQGGELAAGLRYTPTANWPVHLTVERRQRIGSEGGRSAFAAFAEGGFYRWALPLELRLDGYAQAGVVGAAARDLFVDGALIADRPLLGPVGFGAGLWGGAQPGVHRLDAGPRATMRLTPAMRLDLDYRLRLIGKAAPGSGPAVTIAADF